MKGFIRGEKADALDASQKSINARNIGVLWLLIALMFLAFNAAYWPVRVNQSRNAPDNFLEHARYLYARGDREQAFSRLTEGIARFRPPCPEPYQVLSEWQSEARREYLRWCLAAGLLYQALQSEDAAREALLAQAAERQGALLPTVPMRGQREKQVRSLAGNLGALWDMEKSVAALPVERQLALLSLSGGDAIDFSGQIGGTGVKAPADILVQSGGGPAGRYCTHILLGDRDYAGDRRGFHVALIDPQRGRIAQTGSFDVWESVEEAIRMEAFLRDAPAGTIGAFAVADEASVNLTLDLEQALCSFGLSPRTYVSNQPALFGLNFSFAALGVKGAPRGSAIQAWSPDEFGGCNGHAVTCGSLHLPEDGE
jgi:hypothetical protein